MNLPVFSFFLIYFAACLSVVFSKILSDNETHINWITDNRKNLLHEESPVEHVRHLSTKTQKLSEQNEDILKHLQQLNESRDVQGQNNHDAKLGVSSNTKKPVRSNENSSKYLQANKRTKKNKPTEKESSKNRNVEDSFIQVEKHNNNNNRNSTNTNKEPRFKSSASNETRKSDLSNDTGKHVEEDVSQYVSLLTELGNETKEEEKKNGKVRQENNEQFINEYDYDDAHHTMYIYNGDKSRPDIYKKYKPRKGKGNMKIERIESLEYLGAGYDFLFGNPIGDPVLKVDPGYRDAIIKLTYPKFDDDYPDAYKSKSPNGTFVRNEISCNRLEQSQQISTMNQYKKELSSETRVSVGIFGFTLFSASVGYKSTSELMQKNKYKLFMLKNLCFQYVASLSSYGQWQLTDQFNRSVSMLPSYFNSSDFEETTCTVSELKLYPDTEKCGPSVHKWLTFFKNFGTHVSTLVHLGGKITQLMKVSKSETKSSNSSTTSGSASIGFSASTDNTSTEQENSTKSSASSFKETIVIGGTTIYDPSNPEDFENWAKSVRKYPMPIQGEYEPLSKILPTRLIDAYTEALEFYVGLYGHVMHGRHSAPIDVTKTDLRKMLRDSVTLVSEEGIGSVTGTCPINQYVVAGFAFSFPKSFESLDNFSLSACSADETTCTSETNDMEVYNYLFMMCSEEPIPFMEQQATSENTEEVTLYCDNKNQIVLWGFFIVYHTDQKKKEHIKIVNCKYGKNQCTFSDEELARQSLRMRVTGWIVCAHEDFINSAHTTKVFSAVAEKKNNKEQKKQLCPPDMLFDLTFSISAKQFDQSIANCMAMSNVCRENDSWCLGSSESLSNLNIMVY